MLVLTRKDGQRIWIGEAVRLTVVAARNGQVRLAFEAPEGVTIDREEVRKRRQQLLHKTPHTDNGGGGR
jgi:carbon storage regulator